MVTRTRYIPVETGVPLARKLPSSVTKRVLVCQRTHFPEADRRSSCTMTRGGLWTSSGHGCTVGTEVTVCTTEAGLEGWGATWVGHHGGTLQDCFGW